MSSEKAISDNITTTISDYLPQFLISPNTFADPPSNKFNVFEGEWSNFDQENFVLDYFDIDWPNILRHVENNIKSVTNNLLDTINSVLNKYALHLEKLISISLDLKKSWMTSGIQKSICIKNY